MFTLSLVSSAQAPPLLALTPHCSLLAPRRSLLAAWMPLLFLPRAAAYWPRADAALQPTSLAPTKCKRCCCLPQSRVPAQNLTPEVREDQILEERPSHLRVRGEASRKLEWSARAQEGYMHDVLTCERSVLWTMHSETKSLATTKLRKWTTMA